jgi:hypothetical protein
VRNYFRLPYNMVSYLSHSHPSLSLTILLSSPSLSLHPSYIKQFFTAQAPEWKIPKSQLIGTHIN